MKVSEARLNEYKTRPRSWSQLSSWESCPKSYFLERIAEAWQKPAAWFSTGNAVHSAVEHWEKENLDLEGALKVAQRAFRDDANKQLADTPNPDAWSLSGRYRGSVDIPRRYEQLRAHLENYDTLRATLPPLRAGESSEVRLSATMGGVEVIGFADQIREGVMVDIKAGSSTPKTADQMKLYAIAVEQGGGPVIDEAAFVMTAPSVNKVIRHDLTLISTESLGVRFRAMDDGVKAGRFDPTPGDPCRRCSVWSSCPEGQAYTAAENAARAAARNA